MNIGRRAAKVLGLIGLTVAATTLAQADTITQITSLSGNDSASWGSISANPNVNTFPNSVANGATVTTGSGNTVTVSFSAAPGVPGAVYIVGTSWTIWGSPAPETSGSFLLSTHDTGSVADTLTLTFTTPIAAFGTYIQDDASSGGFTASIVGTFSGGGSSSTFTSVSGSASNPVFIGISDTAASIKSITLDVTGSSQDHFFAIGNLIIQTTPTGGGQGSVPEPSSVLMMASGAAALLWKVRRRA